MKKIVAILICIVTGTLVAFSQCCPSGGTSFGNGNTPKCTVQSYYACPSHTDFRSEKAGKCLQCGSPLVKKTEKPNNKAKKNVYYTCKAHPEVRQQDKGKCPQCDARLKKQKEIFYE